MREQQIARIVHFNFRKAQDCDLFYPRAEKETAELAKETLQRTIIKVDDKSLILFALYKNEEDLHAAGDRINPWIAQFKKDDAMETIPVTGEVVLNELNYTDDK